MRPLALCVVSVHEVEVILLEGGVNLEGDLLHDLAVIGVLDDEEVSALRL